MPPDPRGRGSPRSRRRSASGTARSPGRGAAGTGVSATSRAGRAGRPGRPPSATIPAVGLRPTPLSATRSPSWRRRVASAVVDPLLTDLYEFTMAAALLAEGKAEEPATFSLFV